MDQDLRTIVTIVGHEPDFGATGELVSITGCVASCCRRGRCMQRPCEWVPGKLVNIDDPM